LVSFCLLIAKTEFLLGFISAAHTGAANQGIQMADTSLTKEQGLLLLGKLAQDDAFRNSFEHKPAEALFRLGIPAELICCLPAKCLCPSKLDSKEAMEHARKQLANDADTSALQFIIPQPGFASRKP